MQEPQRGPACRLLPNPRLRSLGRRARVERTRTRRRMRPLDQPGEGAASPARVWPARRGCGSARIGGEARRRGSESHRGDAPLVRRAVGASLRRRGRMRTAWMARARGWAQAAWQAAGSRQHGSMAGGRRQAAGGRLQAAGCRLQAAGSKAGSMAGSRQQAAGWSSVGVPAGAWACRGGCAHSVVATLSRSGRRGPGEALERHVRRVRVHSEGGVWRRRAEI